MLSERELAFIALHKDNYPRVYSYIQRRINDAELAQELTADVFRVVWQKPQPTGSEIAWLLTIARNLVGNAYRARDRQQALQEKLRFASTTISPAHPLSTAATRTRQYKMPWRRCAKRTGTSCSWRTGTG